MRTHLEFISSAFGASEEDRQQDLRPKALAIYLAEQLRNAGFSVPSIYEEDWGWVVELKNPTFALWVGCGIYSKYDEGFLCFIEPSKPHVLKFLKKVDTRETVERAAQAMDLIFRQSGKVDKMRWWTEDEV